MRLTQQLLTALILLNIVNAYDSDDCIADFTNMATYTNVVEDPEDFLIDFTADVCIPMLSNAENAYKTFVCSYSSLFVLEVLQEVYADEETSSDTVTIYIEDYCNNVADGTQEKINTIGQLNTIDTADSDYEDQCIDYLQQYDNYWFDPIIPSEYITYGDTCDAFQSLFYELEQMQINSMEDIIIYSYVLVYQMSLNAKEEAVFQTCVDAELAYNPQTYCEQNVVAASNFTIWDSDKATVYCSESAQNLDANCQNETTIVSSSGDGSLTTVAEETCMPCAYTISYVYSVYLADVTSLLEDVFAQVAYNSEEALEEAQRMATGDDNMFDPNEEYTVEVADQSMSITLPSGVDGSSSS